MPQMRNVRYAISFEESRVLINPDIKRTDEMLFGIEWWMSTNAEACPLINSGPFRLARAAEPDDDGLLQVYFTIDPDGGVTAWHVNRVADPLAEEEDAS